MKAWVLLVIVGLAIMDAVSSLAVPEPTKSEGLLISRRGIFHKSALVAGITSTSWFSTLAIGPDCSYAASSTPVPDLKFSSSPSGLQYADVKLGSGQPIIEKGSLVAVDYVMSTTGARYGSKIYSTADKGAPYRWKLGDGSTIQGLENAIRGGDGVEPMRPGGIRRIIIPSKLAYESLQNQDCQQGKGIGPIPPAGEGTAGEYYQRFKNIYCNPNRAYQPDIVMDVKLYGKR